MSILQKAKDTILLSPNRIPRKIKNLKRWRMTVSKVEEYIDYITNFDKKDVENPCKL